MEHIPMMQWFTDSSSTGAIYALIIVVSVLGLISVYLSYRILMELRESKKSLERVEKLLKSVE